MFYVPAVPEHTDFELEHLIGHQDGHADREQLMRSVGRCWHKIDTEIK